ncbi:BnaA06g16040D [Brassica napus]|uniref:BnaA06g16040D protein n=2 Tax=Brassica TaxID=3705 RepID=A0A078F4W0_BRANA|nr:BnaA06g16040D [Brassica napus]VDC66386.1 unnamed protein product [Brassica rapa]
MKLVMFISFLLVLSLCSSGLEEGHEVAENKVEELYGHKMMDYPGPHPDPRDNPPPPPPPTDEENIMENSVN